MVSSTTQPHFTPGKDPVPILQEAGWAPGPVWMGGKSHPHRDSILDCPARSQSLYRLSYLANITNIFFFFFHQGPGHMLQMHRSLIDLLCHPSNVQVVLTCASSPPSRPRYPRDPWQRRTELLLGRETWPTILPKMPDFHVTFRDLLHAVRHGTDGFTSPPKEGVLRIFSP
jgi:hypothetical protein